MILPIHFLLFIVCYDFRYSVTHNKWGGHNKQGSINFLALIIEGFTISMYRHFCSYEVATSKDSKVYGRMIN